MSKLNSSPLGWLNLFQAKVEGQNPDEIGKVIVPQADIADMFGLQVIVEGVQLANLQNAGDAISLTVPTKEMWRVRAMSVEVAAAGFTALNVGAAPFVSLKGLTTPASSLTYLGQTQRLNIATLATSIGVAGLYFERPLLVTPGNAIGFVITDTLAASTAAQLRILLEQLPA